MLDGIFRQFYVPKARTCLQMEWLGATYETLLGQYLDPLRDDVDKYETFKACQCDVDLLHYWLVPRYQTAINRWLKKLDFPTKNNVSDQLLQLYAQLEVSNHPSEQRQVLASHSIWSKPVTNRKHLRLTSGLTLILLQPWGR